MAGFEPWSRERGAEIIAAKAGREGATLPILHALQAAFGYIHAEAIPMIAEALNLTRAEVHGVVSFYHDFRRHPPGRHVLRLCRAEACQSLGADALAAHRAPAAGRRLARHDGGRRGDAGAGVLPGPVRDRSVGACWMARRLAGWTTRGSTRRWSARDDARVYVPRDAAALALGADAVAALLRQAGDVEVVRTGSRGLFWLEPMVEVETPAGPHRLRPGDARRTFPVCSAPGMLTGGAHRAAPGPAGGDPVPGAADPADLRPLRHRRSAVAG